MSLKKNIDSAKRLLIEDKLNKIAYLKRKLKKSKYEEEDFDDQGFQRMLYAHDQKWLDAKERDREYEPGKEWIEMFIDMITHPNIPDHALELVVNTEDPLIRKIAWKEHAKPYSDSIFPKHLAMKLRSKLGYSDNAGKKFKQMIESFRPKKNNDIFDHLFKSEALDNIMNSMSSKDKIKNMSFKDLYNYYRQKEIINYNINEMDVVNADRRQAAFNNLPDSLKESFLKLGQYPKGRDIKEWIRENDWGETDEYKELQHNIYERLSSDNEVAGPKPTEEDISAIINDKEIDYFHNDALESPHLSSRNIIDFAKTNPVAFSRRKSGMRLEGAIEDKLNSKDLTELISVLHANNHKLSPGIANVIINNPNSTPDHYKTIFNNWGSTGDTNYKRVLMHPKIPLSLSSNFLSNSEFGRMVSKKIRMAKNETPNSAAAKEDLDNLSSNDIVRSLVVDHYTDDMNYLANHHNLNKDMINKIIHRSILPMEQKNESRIDPAIPKQLTDNYIFNVAYVLMKHHSKLDDSIKQNIFEKGNSNQQKALALNEHNTAKDLKYMFDQTVDRKGDIGEAILTHPNADRDLLKEGMDYHPSAVLSNPNAPSDVIEKVLNDPKFRYQIAEHPNTTSDQLWHIFENTNDKDISEAVASHPNAPEQMFEEHLKKYPTENEIETKIGSHRLRQLRDFIEEKGGEVSKKEAEKAGFNLKSLGVDSLVSPKGKINANDVDSHIENSPGMHFTHSSDTYGSSIEPEDVDESDWDNWPEEALEEARDAAREQVWDDFDTHEHLKDNFDYDSMPEDVAKEYDKFALNKMKQEKSNQGISDEGLYDLLHQSPSNENEYLNEFYDEVGSAGSNDYPKSVFDWRSEAQDSIHGSIDDIVDHDAIGGPDDWPLREWGHEPNEPDEGGWSEGNYSEALQEQRHTPETSDVFQLNLHPRQINKMKRSGVWGTFEKMHEASSMSGHPIGDNGIGWVRYTQSHDGIHIDEIQSDFGQSFMKQLKQMKKEADSGNTRAAEKLKEYPQHEVEKINEIVFGKHHPSQILHDSFLQSLRSSGMEDTPVHIWHSSSKGPISNQETPQKELHSEQHGGKVPVSLARYHELKPEHQKHIAEDAEMDITNTRSKYNKAVERGLYNPDTGESQITPENYDKWNDIHQSTRDTHYYIHKKTKEPIRDEDGSYQRTKPLPVHMQETYEKQPKQMGYKPAEYGKLETQHNPSLKGKSTWEDKVRKTDDEDYDTLEKAPTMTDPEDVKEYMSMIDNKVHSRNDEKHLKTYQLPNGLYHHVYDARDSDAPEVSWGSDTRHILSVNKSPIGPGLAHIYTSKGIAIGEPTEEKGVHQILASLVDPKHKGRGYGSILYDSTLKHHGKLASGHQTSTPAEKQWQTWSTKNPNVDVKLAPRDSHKSHIAMWNPKTNKIQKTDNNEDYDDQIKGGKADKKKPSDFDQKQLKMGINVEMEHTNDPAKAMEIAMDHLSEDPNYYTKLKTVHND